MITIVILIFTHLLAFLAGGGLLLWLAAIGVGFDGADHAELAELRRLRDGVYSGIAAGDRDQAARAVAFKSSEDRGD
jgi:hypothetical protein